MPELFKTWIGVIIRMALTVFSTWLVSKKLLTPDQATGMLDHVAVGIAGVAATLAWSLWQKYRSKLKFFTALELPANATPDTVAATIANAPAGVNVEKALQ